jgi:hypothetical protein
MSKQYQIRADVNMTVDFDITANTEADAKCKLRHYLRYVEGGKVEEQDISVKCKKGDGMTNCFIMDVTIDDCNEVC